MSDNGPPQSRLGNTDYQWDQFDPEAYFQHYYGEPHPDDERVIRCAGRGHEAGAADRRRAGRGRCRHRPQSHSIFLRLASSPATHGLGICGGQYCLARVGATPQRDALTMASLLERYPRGISAGVLPTRRSDAPSAREEHCPTRFNLRSPRAHMGRRDHVLLRGIHHRATRRIRSRMRRLCALCEARRRLGRSLSRAFGRLCRQREPISRFVSICRRS